MFACRNGHIDVARMLLADFGVDTNVQNEVIALAR